MNLITDRTAQDLDRVKILAEKAWQDMTEEERAEWLSPMKGAYNYTDFNRVGVALNYVRDRLIETGYLSAGVFEAKVNWSVSDIVTETDLRGYLRDVSTIREALARYDTTPAVPEYSGSLNYIEANNIEKILLDVDALITNMISILLYSNDFYAGEVWK